MQIEFKIIPFAYQLLSFSILQGDSNMRRISLRSIAISVLCFLLLVVPVSAEPDAIDNLPGGGWWSAESLQNVGTKDTQVNATVYGSNNTQASTTFTIKKGEGATILPQSFGVEPFFPNFTGSGAAVVSAGEPLVAIVTMTNRKVGNLAGVEGGYAAGIYEGTDSSGLSTTLNFPIAKQNYGNKTTTYFVQNAGSTAAVINATFNFGNGQTANWSSNTPVQPGRGVAITPPNAMPSGSLGSAIVSSTVQLAGAYTEYPTGQIPAKVAKAARAMVTSDAGTVLLVPAFKKNHVGRSSAIAIQGNAALTGNIVYTCAPGSACQAGTTRTVNFTTTGAGKSYVAWPYSADHNTLTDGLYAAKITITGGGPAVAIAEETYFPNPPAINRDTTYAAFPEAKAAMKWVCPVVKERYQGNGSGLVVNPTTYPASVSVTYAVVDSMNGQFKGNSYKITNSSITSGSGVFFDVAANSGNFTWAGGTALPGSTGTTSAVTVESNVPVVVIVNENVHFLPAVNNGLQQDAKQYNCFSVTN
jgi:hypothetical protein